MRLSDQKAQEIRRIAEELFEGELFELILFGSRVDDDRRGGDVDLFVSVKFPVNRPAMVIAKLAARTSRIMQGRKVDVVLEAPNLQHLPIHDVARATGIQL